jgi:hypothetical protein
VRFKTRCSSHIPAESKTKLGETKRHLQDRCAAVRRLTAFTKMSLRHILAAIAAIIAVPLIVYSWLESRADRAQLQATLAAQQQMIDAAESREHESAAELKTSLDQIAVLKRQVQTPAQIISSLPQYLPLPEPITLYPAPRASALQSSQLTGSSPDPQQGIALEKGTVAPRAPSDPATSLPDSPPHHRPATDLLSALKSEISNFKSSRSLTSPVPNAASSRGAQTPDQPATHSGNAEIPDADLKPLYDFVQDCRACQAQLAAANANLIDEQARSVALARERNAAVTAARGGGFWRQLKRNTKWLAIGAAVGVVLARGR